MDARIEKMADVIINYSLAVQPGERVLIRSTSPAGEPLAQATPMVSAMVCTTSNRLPPRVLAGIPTGSPARGSALCQTPGPGDGSVKLDMIQ